MNGSQFFLWVGLAAVMNTIAAEPIGEIPQLMQLNRASQQELRDIQSTPGSLQAPATAERPWREKPLDREQQAQQETLQESQRREVLMERQRARTTNKPASTHRLDAIGRQRQFRLQQQNQLNRFRTRQQGRGR